MRLARAFLWLQANLSTLARYGIGAALVLVLTFRALVDPVRTIWALLFDSAIVVVVGGLLLLFFRNARVFVDKEQVGKVDLLGRLKTLSLRDMKGAERFSVLNRYGSVKHLVFVGPDGRKAFEVTGSSWDFDRLDAQCLEAGIELGGTYDETVSPFRLNKRVPGTITWGRQLLIALGGDRGDHPVHLPDRWAAAEVKGLGKRASGRAWVAG
jgi:hypothetical protein